MYQALDSLGMNSRCQRHTQIFDTLVAAMIPTVPWPSAVKKSIRARHTRFSGDQRAAMSASIHTLSNAVPAILIPLRIAYRRTAATNAESSTGLVCPNPSTRSCFVALTASSL